ncbi:MAG: T9SS type A sorting domain-containing protein [Aequorivita antarctica]
MKTLLLTVSVLFSITSFSQTYLPMLEEGNIWNTITHNYPEPVIITSETYEITGQQVIGGFTYYSFNGYSCLMREENGKVYAYSQSQSAEELFFDFTLEVGDEFIIDPTYTANCYYIGGVYIEGTPITVSNVSTQFIAGNDRKVIELEYEGQPVETWVEGIGSLNGFTPFGFTNFDGFSSLSCFTNNGITYFFNGYTECLLGVNDFDKDAIKLAPNPVTQNSTINIPFESEIDFIKIFDVFGRLVKNEIIYSEYVNIDANEYASGMYIYQLFSKDKMVKTDKFIVN